MVETARVGIPVGLEAQNWRLQERGEIVLFETRPCEVTLSGHGIRSQEGHAVVFDLVVVIPGLKSDPSSSEYPYPDHDEKAWGEGVTVDISRRSSGDIGSRYLLIRLAELKVSSVEGRSHWIRIE